MSIETISIDLGNDRQVTIETGKQALLAGGSVTVQQGDTVVLVCACSAKPRPGLDFFPLQVDYRERFSAAGIFPGGFFKREGRPSEKEILTARMTDRPLRTLFPKGYIDDVQIMSTLQSADGQNEADVLSIFGASVALIISDIPFTIPIGALRVGRVDGEFIANPTHKEMAESDLDLVYAGIEGKAIMIEGRASEVSEEDMKGAMEFADTIVIRMIAAQNELAARVNKAKAEPELHLVAEPVLTAVADYCAANNLADVVMNPGKSERYAALDAFRDKMVEALAPQFEDADEAPNFKAAHEEVTEQTVRRLALEEGKRMDGRGAHDLRAIECEVGVLPRTHGSALFKRGETQSLVTTTLGPSSECQKYDAITGGDKSKQFFLHYNFPNFSVGETGRIMGPGRREIGHGALAERSIAHVVPVPEFDYAIRCVSDILGSNGSSSMASICGASLAMMDAGVPLKDAVAGISVGMVSEGDKRVFLVDILGAEDHYGDMDFKLAGTRKGITGFQLDLKVAGLDLDGMYEAMLLNKKAREEIHDVMASCIDKPRAELSQYAPQVFTMHINPEKIGALIGPGGKIIRGITDKTGAQINIEDDGSVHLFTTNAEMLEAVKEEVNAVVAEVEIGKIYQGVVQTIKDFGAFVEVLPGQDGLLHISEMADYRVNRVEDICKVGDTVTVKVVDVDQRGRIRLSRKDALQETQ